MFADSGLTFTGSAVCTPSAAGEEDPDTFTVTYTDGVDGEELFADQITGNLSAGAETPVFNGTPTRTGYTFAGWSPTVSATVTGSVTYTATWTPLQYTITFNTDGGNDIDPITLGVGTPIVAPTVPTKDGFIFVGWDTPLPETMPAEDLTFTALWEDENTHVHEDVDNEWESDGTYHWHTCRCTLIFDKVECSGGTATCTDKPVCSVCENEYGTELGHDYADATCTAPKTCKRDGCGHTDGEALGHSFTQATCTAPKTCTRDGCGHTEGVALGHNYSAATCTAPKTCQRAGCGHTDGEALGHDFSEATCTAPKTCQRDGCGTTEGEALGHDLTAATCTEAAKCKRADCGLTEGKPLGHDFADATCTETKKCKRAGCGVTDGLPLGHLHSETYTTSETEHWNQCVDCDDKINVAAHSDADGDGKCDVCAYDPDGASGGNSGGGAGLSSGAIIGIAGGSAAVVGIGGFSLVWFVIKKKKWSDLISLFKKTK